MAVMRVEKNLNYTVMANYHLRDKEISLKAKGLLSLMLSLPSEWDYTLAGLAYINKEGIDAIRTAIKELEKAGYIVRARQRNEAGQLLDTEYLIYEYPQNSDAIISSRSVSSKCSDTPPLENPILENPILDNPTLDLPILEEPMLEKPIQINKDINNTDLSNPDQSNIHLSITKTEHRPIITNHIQTKQDSEVLSKQAISTNTQRLQRKLSCNELEYQVKDQIEYWNLIDENDKDEIDNIVAIMTEVLSAKCDHFTISGKEYPIALVHQRFNQINYHIILYVLECLHKCGSDIKNIKQYLIATLFNAPATCDSYYSAAVRRDLEFMRQ